ncbi:MAG: NAD(+) synthase, partial [Treponema sp.]|nr:NAD(+) synthase [Treponema sp.]
MNYGFFRVCCASPQVTVADCNANSLAIIESIRQAAAENAGLVVFPELSITGYTCSDLFFQRTLQQEALNALMKIAAETASYDILAVTGLPFAAENSLYNCAAVTFRGKILALIPKSFIPNYGEFYERRQFAPAAGKNDSVDISDTFNSIPFGTDILITAKNIPDFRLAVEICEDVWVPVPPSTRHTLAGATVVANLSASNEIIGKAAFRRLLVKSQSAHTISAYLYADAGQGESTTDMVFASHNLIAENGRILCESNLFSEELIFADLDLERLVQERRRTTTFAQSVSEYNSENQYRKIPVDLKTTGIPARELKYPVESRPFVPSGRTERTERCREVIMLQAHGLAKRLRHIQARTVVLGLSGGLDSTLALLVTAAAFDLCSLPHSGIQAVTMPCFGTTDRTYRNACSLARKTGAALSEIPIREAVLRHFSDIGQDPEKHDVTYENCQARERTQVLMDLANKTGGIVIGTGDLSELALGWATYNGDHMSMYGVNSSVPKTLVRYLVEWFADETRVHDEKLAAVLRDILETPVSPELLPPDEGRISQKTEELVGPYELHDFFLYYVLRFGFSPAKIYYLAQKAFCTENRQMYSKNTILKWLR